MISEPATSPTPAARPPRRVLLNTVFSVLTKAQGFVFSYATTLLLLRALKVEEYGLYAVLFVGTIANVSLLGKLGLPSTLLRFVPEYFAQSNWRLIGRLFTAANLLQSAFSAVLLALTFVFAPRIAIWIQFPNAENVIRVFAVGAFAFLLAENYRVLLSGMFMHRAIFFCTLAYNAARLVTIFAVTRRADPFPAVVVAEAALYGLFLAIYYVVFRRKIRPLTQGTAGGDTAVPWRRFARYTVLSYINEAGVMLLNSASDLFLVSGILGGAAVGVYALADRIMGLIQNALPNNFLQGVITPLFFSEYGASRENARFGFTLLVKISLFMTIPIALWTALMARPLIVELFDPRYAEAAGLLTVMVMFLPMEVLRFPLGLMLQNAERNDLLIYSKVFGVIKIAIGLWLLPKYGVLAMAWITALAIVGQNVLSYVWIVTVLRSGTDLVGVLRLFVNGAVAAALFFLMRPLFTGVAGVVASVFVFAAIYLAVCLIHKTFTSTERDFINSKLPRPLWKF